MKNNPIFGIISTFHHPNTQTGTLTIGVSYEVLAFNSYIQFLYSRHIFTEVTLLTYASNLRKFHIIWFENWFGSFLCILATKFRFFSLCTHSNKLSGKQAFSMSLTLIIVSTTKMFFKSLVGKLIIIILLQLMQWINSLGKCLFNTKETKNFQSLTFANLITLYILFCFGFLS